MRNFLAPMELLLAVPSVAALFFPIIISQAQAPVPRITAEIDNSQRTAIKGSHPPMARAEIDAGRVPAGTKLQGISVVFSRTAAQEAAVLRKNSMDGIDPSRLCSLHPVFHSSGPRREVASSSTQSSSV